MDNIGSVEFNEDAYVGISDKNYDFGVYTKIVFTDKPTNSAIDCYKFKDLNIKKQY